MARVRRLRPGVCVLARPRGAVEDRGGGERVLQL